MPNQSRVFLLLLVLVATWLAVPPTESIAQKARADRAAAQQSKLAYPPAPRRDYTPRHVRQRLNNCAFSSAQMLIDKWTEGRVTASQNALRRATGIPSEDGGPTLSQLRRAVAKVARIDMRWSPNGGDPLTWQELLERLGDGGGALVNVWPEKLPRQYRRWIPTLTRGHSAYVERYNAAKNRIWLMDPLGRGQGFQGEWIDADVLHRAMWRPSNGYVWAAATPKRPRSPSLGDFDVGTPSVAAVGFRDGTLELAIEYAARRSDARLPPLRVAAQWQRLPDEQPVADDPAETPALMPIPLPLASTTLQPHGGLAAHLIEAEESSDEQWTAFEMLSGSVVADGQSLRTALVTPELAGDYVLSLELRDGDGRPLDAHAPDFEPIEVRLRGPLAGSLAGDFVLPDSVRRGETLPLTVEVANLGSAAWGEDAEPVALAVRSVESESMLSVPLEVASKGTTSVPLSLFVDWPVGRTSLRLSLIDATGTDLAEAAAIQFVLDVRAAGPDEIR